MKTVNSDNLWPAILQQRRATATKSTGQLTLCHHRNGGGEHISVWILLSTTSTSPTTMSQGAIFKVFICTALFVVQICAKQTDVARLPNGANVQGVAALGHTNPTGSGPANAFGNAFARVDYVWTAAFCQADTDGDGQTNGQELGDPCCVWVKGDTPRWTSGVSHPGDASKTSNASLWSNLTCTSAMTTATSGSGATWFVALASALVVVGMLVGVK